jgi:formylglycine-generating enzyme required for sulfatase activity
MSRFLSMFLISCLAYISPLSAQKGCCDDSFSKGIDAFRAKNYNEALRLFSQGKSCNKKCIHDFNALIKRVKEEQKVTSASKMSQIPVPRSTPSVSTLFVEPQMVKVEGGMFQMGSNQNENEKPIHPVKVSGFYIGKYEVTQAEWRSVMGEDPEELMYYKGDSMPVQKVSWNDIQDFLQKINVKTGKKYRLPTEAEWEFAARGGNNSKGYTYSGSDDVKSVAWMGENAGNRLHKVGGRNANELGIYDMSGNIWEQCEDWYKGYLGSSGVNDFKRTRRVIRGGGMSFGEEYCLSTYRSYLAPSYRADYAGFRLALSSL